VHRVPATWRYFLVVCLRHRMAAVVGGIGAAVLVTAIAGTFLTPGTEQRSYFDAAYLGIELMAVLVPVMASAVLHVLEFEQRASWLILVRPVTRAGYGWGRFAGLTTVSWLGTLGLWLAVAALAAAGRALPEPWLVPVLVSSLLVAPVASAVCCLVSFLSTSYVTGAVVSFGLVILGWMSPALPLLAAKAPNAVLAWVLTGIYWVLPHLGDFSVRDMTAVPEAWYLWLLGIYAVAYSVVAGFAANAVLARREV